MSWIDELHNIQVWKKYSQFGEEAYLDFIFGQVGTGNKFFVEFGALDGKHLSNTLYLKETGWDGLLMDGKDYGNPDVRLEWITKNNIVELLKKYKVLDFDLLSIDMDGNDYWVLDELLKSYSPRVVVAEFNCSLVGSVTITYDSKHEWLGDNYFGFSFDAGKSLMEKHGYELVMQNDNVNMYFVKKNLLDCAVPKITYEQFFAFPVRADAKWVSV